jgi:hypothetical protein
MGTEFGLAFVTLSLQPQLQTVKKSTWFLFLVLFAVSCLDEPDCYLLNNDIVRINFRVIGSGKSDSVAIRSAIVENTIALFQETHDTIITTVALPLNYHAESTLVNFASADQEKLLQLGYEVQVQFVSDECGPRYILSNLKVLEAQFDSIRVVNNTPGRDGSTVNLEIFRCPVTNILALTFNQLTLPATTTTSTARSSFKSATLNGITIDNLETVYTDTSTATVYLPVNLNATTTSYAFDIADNFGLNQPQRNLSVSYTTNTAVHYNACGLQTLVQNLKINAESTLQGFDSVSLARDSEGRARSGLSDPFLTNVNVYRCPETNIVQLAFRTNGTTTDTEITSITAAHTSEIFYANSTVNTIQLPLDQSSNSTVYTINYPDRSETITLNHTWSPMPAAFFKNACKDRTITTTLSNGDGATNVQIANASVLYPPVTNVYVEVP